MPGAAVQLPELRYRRLAEPVRASAERAGGELVRLDGGVRWPTTCSITSARACYIVLVSAICYFVAKLAHWSVGQAIFRIIGLVLLTAAASATFYSFWPHKVYTFPMGSGGVLGVSTGVFLKSNFARLGAFILILATWIVGLALLADSLIVGLFAACGIAVRRVVGVVVPAWAVAKEHSEALTEIWQRLSATQKTRDSAAADECRCEEEPEVAEQDVEPAGRGRGRNGRAGTAEARSVAAGPVPAPAKRPEMTEVKRSLPVKTREAAVRPALL